MSKKTAFILLADISNFADYNLALLKLTVDRTCPNCGIVHALHGHGSYLRQADRQNNSTDSFNPVPIKRFICTCCGKTSAAIPEFIPPRRWYLWVIQQAVIQAILNGKSLHWVNRKYGMARSTCRRWMESLKDRFIEHAHFLRNLPGDLGESLLHCFKLETFWNTCFSWISLARAMLLCHRGGLSTP